jgi:hypothetical protein
MAATGLLGFNPYGKAPVIDISSKPLQLAIQLQQKEQAKSEAYEKYFMDYEKSLNPAGLAQGESKEFLNKYNRIKENWIKNKQAILNPAKYGYDAQSQYFADLKDAQMYIDQGKQASAERKAFNTYLDQARKSGKHIAGDLEVTNNAMKTVGLGYEAPDTSKIEIYDPHDSIDFTEKTWRGIDLPGKIEPEYEMVGGKKTGREKPVMVESITSDVAKVYDQRAKGYYGSSIGTQKQYNELLKDKELVANLNPIYSKYFNKNIENGAELLSAVGLASKQPKREEKTSFDFPKSWYFNQGQNRQDARASLAAAATANAAGGSIDDYINASDTKKVIPEDATLTELTFGPKVADEYIVKKTVPKDAVQYAKMVADENAPYETKTVVLTPKFGRKGNDVLVAYSALDKNGKETGKYDWKNAKPLTADVRSTILNKVAGSKFKVTALESNPSKKKTGSSNLND